MTDLVRCVDDGAVRVLTLDRPDRRNALTPAMLDVLHDLVVAPSGAGCIVLQAAGPMFCSGFDLDLCQGDPGGGTMRRLLTGLSEVVRALRGQPQPVVIAAQGGAIAGGCALLGGADLVVADRRAKFGYPVVRLGVSPAVSAPTLFRSVSQGSARRLQLDPTLVDATEANRLGLVHVLVDDPGQVIPLALARGKEMASKPRDAMAATRAWTGQIEDALGLDFGLAGDAALATSISLTGGLEERLLLRPPGARVAGPG